MAGVHLLIVAAILKCIWSLDSEMLLSYEDRLTPQEKTLEESESVDGHTTIKLQKHLEVSGSLPNPEKAMK